MTLRYLLDTSTLSAGISAKPNRMVLQRLTQRGPQCAIASIVWNELIYGCERLEAGKRKVELEADYVGFECPDHFVVGYGMDVAYAFRELPFVGVVTGDAE